MTGLTVLLAYATWAAAPLVAYAALGYGLRRAHADFALLFAIYAAAVALVWVALRAKTAGEIAMTVAPISVVVPFAGVAVLSALLYALGAWIGGGK